MQVKIHQIAANREGIPVMGLTVPREISLFFPNGTFFHVEKSGTAILFISGTNNQPTKQQIRNYKFEDCRC